MTVKAKFDDMPVWVEPDRIVFVNWRLIDGSTNVHEIGWPASGEPLMLVRYMSGKTYGYIGASRQLAVAAANAKSVGKFINKRVKPKYKAVEIV